MALPALRRGHELLPIGRGGEIDEQPLLGRLGSRLDCGLDRFGIGQGAKVEHEERVVSRERAG